LANIFGGIGLSKKKKEEVQKEKVKHNENNTSKVIKKKHNNIAPEDCLYDKTYVCPVCDNVFKARAVRKNKAKFIGSDIDLKANYEPVQPDYYEIIMCSKCGYAAITQTFDKISSKQAELILKHIKPNFKPVKYSEVYDAAEALDRYQKALLNWKAKKGRIGEKAFICLKMAWIYRDMKKEKEEFEFLKVAYDGFNEAFLKENFPICGLEENTLLYILSVTASKLGDNDEAKRILGRLVIKRGLGERLRQKAEDFKAYLKTVE